MRIIFMGTPDFSVPTLRALAEAGHDTVLAVTQPDRPKGRKRALCPPPVKVAALEMGVPVFQPERLGEEGAFERLSLLRPDAVVVVAFGQILKTDVLSLPRLGCVNAHASLLPRYRGAAPIQWAIANGDETTGVTTMLMNEGVDTGDVLLRREVGIRADHTGGSLHDELAVVSGELVVETLAGLEDGSIKPEPQDESLAGCAPMLKKEDGRIDWSMDAAMIERRSRAFDPWPGSFTRIGDLTVKVSGLAAVDAVKSGAPGEVIEAGPGGVLARCGRGAVLIGELQPPGKRMMRVAEYLAGRSIEKGLILG